MELYEIIKKLEAATGNIEKQAILDSQKDNEELKCFVWATLDPAINYYQTKLPKLGKAGKDTFCTMIIDDMIHSLAERRDTGHAAVERLKMYCESLNEQGRELLSVILSRKLGKTKVGETMALKTWPGLFFTVPYQRCSLLDEKAKKHFAGLSRFFVQTKLDGTFAYVVKRVDGSCDVITRQGNTYPQWFAKQMTEGMAAGSVVIGELMLDEAPAGCADLKPEPVDRKTANGIFNSLQKDGEGFDPSIHKATLVAWDMLTQAEFEAGRSIVMYQDRFRNLRNYHFLQAGVSFKLVDHWEVRSLAEAYAIYTDHTSRGLEGCIMSDPASLWKDNTAKDRVKMKLKFQVEMRVKRLYAGEGKAAGTLGGVEMESEDGGIENNCGSGFDDKQRKLFWDHPELILNEVVMVEANDITQSRDGRKKPSLSLPIFCEVRYDKKVADTTERIYQQLEAAKQGA